MSRHIIIVSAGKKKVYSPNAKNDLKTLLIIYGIKEAIRVSAQAGIRGKMFNDSNVHKFTQMACRDINYIINAQQTRSGFTYASSIAIPKSPRQYRRLSECDRVSISKIISRYTEIRRSRRRDSARTSVCARARARPSNGNRFEGRTLSRQ